ncbi:unnamed protein product, partial [Aphanomyces euteiches]
ILERTTRHDPSRPNLSCTARRQKHCNNREKLAWSECSCSSRRFSVVSMAGKCYGSRSRGSTSCASSRQRHVCHSQEKKDWFCSWDFACLETI